MFRLAVLLAVLAVASARNNDVRIIGGKPTPIEKYPHQVSLNDIVNGFFCGGCLVSTQYVLTAGHCVMGKVPQNVSVRVGASYRLGGGLLVGVQNLTLHKNYDNYYIDYDIAVLKLLKPIVVSASVRPISLVPANDKPRVGEILTTTGWGMTAYDAKDSPADSILQVVKVPVVDSDKCGLAHWKYIRDRSFCAGGNLDQGVYYGDSGGPAINEKGQLVGVVSWGGKGNITGKPGVFVDLTYPSIRDFVMENIK